MLYEEAEKRAEILRKEYDEALRVAKENGVSVLVWVAADTDTLKTVLENAKPYSATGAAINGPFRAFILAELKNRGEEAATK